jgi:hypothetical protein
MIRRWGGLAVVVALALGALALPAEGATPARDQYVPSQPDAAGDELPTSDLPADAGDDQVLERIGGGGPSTRPEKKGEQRERDPGIAIVVPPIGPDDGGGDGALGAAAAALMDWSDPVVPGSLAILALFTLAVAGGVIRQRRRQA